MSRLVAIRGHVDIQPYHFWTQLKDVDGSLGRLTWVIRLNQFDNETS